MRLQDIMTRLAKGRNRTSAELRAGIKENPD
jgi:hypothetical protein